MTERPINCRAHEVREILAGDKTMTRMLAWIKPRDWSRFMPPRPTLWQKVQPGDTLWVREAWAQHPDIASGYQFGTLYRASPEYDGMSPGDFGWSWRSPILMPRWASRITLAVTAVRVERLQEITEADARAEGIKLPVSQNGRPLIDVMALSGVVDARRDNETPKEAVARAWTYRAHFASLWNELHDHGAWSRNEAVCVITFDRVTP